MVFNKEYIQLNKEEIKIVTISISIINDMVENLVIEYDQSMNLMKKYSKLLNSFELEKLDDSSISEVYI